MAHNTALMIAMLAATAIVVFWKIVLKIVFALIATGIVLAIALVVITMAQHLHHIPAA